MLRVTIYVLTLTGRRDNGKFVQRWNTRIVIAMVQVCVALTISSTYSPNPNLSDLTHKPVVFGRKFTSGIPGAGATTTIDELKSTAFKEKEVAGTLSCSPVGMGGDPLPGYFKYCMCLTRAVLQAEKVFLATALYSGV